jgi:hypothetical protein
MPKHDERRAPRRAPKGESRPQRALSVPFYSSAERDPFTMMAWGAVSGIPARRRTVRHEPAEARAIAGREIVEGVEEP